MLRVAIALAVGLIAVLALHGDALRWLALVALCLYVAERLVAWLHA